MQRPIRGRARAQAGVTLIELMVAMVISMILAVAVMLIQRSLTMQKTRSSDVALRDNESRAAMDLIAHDVSGAGFLMGGSSKVCDGLITYNNAGYYIHLPVDAVNATPSRTLPFAPSLILNYPAAGAGVASAVLVVTTANTTTRFNDIQSPQVPVSVNGTFNPLSTGVLPVASTQGLTQGHVGILNVWTPLGRACMRVPLTTVAAGTPATVASTGATMPGSFYAGFGAQLSPPFSPLTNLEIFQGLLVDIGDPALPAGSPPPPTTTIFYVDQLAGDQWPTLMRANYSLLDDSLIGTPQPIAAGVVSLQVWFGTDPAHTGSVVPPYKTGLNATGMAANTNDLSIRSVHLALVTRTLFPDPDFTNDSDRVTLPAPFAAVPIPASLMNHRFVVHQADIAVRNWIWTPGH